MQIMTFNEILTYICDEFDTLISPKSISRSNTNIIYLIFKAIAKGFELINNLCVVVSHKFDPAYCSVDDLESVANLVGTERYKGSASGLYITVLNKSESPVTLYEGEYFYKLDEETTFSFEVTTDTEIPAKGTKSYIAMSLTIGRYSVTAQSEIKVTSDNLMSEDLTFSCADNNSLLGTKAETDLEFRKRILSDTNRQDSLTELQTAIKNKPYIFDAKVFFNNEFNAKVIDGITIPPSFLAIFYSGEPKNELAELVASKDIFPTVSTEDSVEVYYNNDVFASGSYTVNLIPFKKFEYAVKLNLKINPSFISIEEAEDSIQSVLYSTMNTMVHKDYIKETDIYNVVNNLNISGVEVLNVDLKVNGETKDYVEVPLSRIPELVSVTFEEVNNV